MSGVLDILEQWQTGKALGGHCNGIWKRKERWTMAEAGGKAGMEGAGEGEWESVPTAPGWTLRTTHRARTQETALFSRTQRPSAAFVARKYRNASGEPSAIL